MSTKTRHFLGLHASEEQSLCREVLRYLVSSAQVTRLLKRRRMAEAEIKNGRDDERDQ